jgi:hypothetical protein
MAKKKKVIAETVAEPPYRFLDDVRKDVPLLYELAASLQPFDDVITEQWCDKDEACIGIGFDMDGRVCPSGVYSLYGARIYGLNRVTLFHDMYLQKGECCREEYSSTMNRLWDLLRQIPRPVHSFGAWQENE